MYFTGRRQEEKSSRENTAEEKQHPGGATRVADRGASGLSEEQRLRLERAFLSLSKNVEGKALLKTMGIRGFVAVRSEWLKRMEGIFDAEEKK